MGWEGRGERREVVREKQDGGGKGREDSVGSEGGEAAP